MTFRPTLCVLLLCFGTALFAQPKPALTDDVFFAPMPVGAKRDSVRIIRGLSPGGQYVVTKLPQGPFALTSSAQDLTIRNDEITLRVSFAPTMPGDFQDELELERQPATGRQNENRIRVRLYGSGFLIERQEDLEFGTINVMDSARRIVLFRSGPADDFEWEYSRAPRAPFRSTTVQGPVRRGRDTLAFIFSFHPTAVGSFADTIGIVRKLRNGQRLDTARLYLRGTAKARPFTLRPELSARSFDVRIGDTLALDVKLVADGPIDIPEQMDELTFDMSYNPTILVPLRTAGQTLSVRDGKQILTVKRDASNGGPLTIDRSGITASRIAFVVALGDAESTLLTLDNASYTTRTISGKGLADQSAIISVTNVWRYQDGRSRLANPLQGVLVLDVDPNPVVESSTMRLRNLPSKGSTLVIVDASGVVVSDLTAKVQAGARDLTIASSGSADVVLPRGTYYARLAVESELGGTLLSVVRLFVIQ
ncbi:MAG: hypothetical protein FGM32_03945 [Candidatus Kapabacteria bacterium]|nr:hypothetical protein [Candidatus Kapabacteria bacterium]